MRSGAVDTSLNTNWMINHFSFSRVYTGSDEMADYVKGNWGKAMLELRLANSVFTLAVAALLFFGLVQV